jgi:thiol:disulfide interchange protein DsbD
MLDFYADWCVSCKEMEAYTFTDPQVKEHLKNFLLIQADVTENNADDTALLQRFNLVGPPGIIFYAPDGQERSGNRIIGYQDAATFINSLKQL